MTYVISEIQVYTHSTPDPFFSAVGAVGPWDSRFNNMERVIDCGLYSGYRPAEDQDKVCRFDLALVTEDCVYQREYGAAEGAPCVMLTLGRVRLHIH